MHCPFCGNADTAVKDSRPTDDGAAIRRRRNCGECGARFTTFERVQLRELNVVKGCGSREPFEREKLLYSMKLALRKRPYEGSDLERIVNSIVRQLEISGETDITSSRIGELAMKALQQMDPVAYVRYASVYKDFHEADDFKEFLGDLEDVKAQVEENPELVEEPEAAKSKAS